MESDLLNTCRSCLRSFNKLRNLYETYTTDGLKLSTYYEICTNLEISEDDELPKMICIMCESNLMTAFYFRRQCVEAVKLFLVNSRAENMEPIHSLPQEIPFAIKKETSEEYETETEELETGMTPMIIDKVEQKFFDIPDPPQENTNSIIDETPAASTEQNLDFISPVLKGPSYFQCPKCQKAFISYRHLEIHLKSHIKELYVCEICNRKCSSKSVLKIHQKKHRTSVVDRNTDILSNGSKDEFVVEYLYGFRPE